LLHPVTVDVTGPVGVLMVMVAGDMAILAPNIVLPSNKKFPVIGPPMVVEF
jgi:hypothetical protein